MAREFPQRAVLVAQNAIHFLYFTFTWSPVSTGMGDRPSSGRQIGSVWDHPLSPLDDCDLTHPRQPRGSLGLLESAPVPSPLKRHLVRFSRFCAVHPCAQRTDRHTQRARNVRHCVAATAPHLDTARRPCGPMTQRAERLSDKSRRRESDDPLTSLI